MSLEPYKRLSRTRMKDVPRLLSQRAAERNHPRRATGTKSRPGRKSGAEGPGPRKLQLNERADAPVEMPNSASQQARKGLLAAPTPLVPSLQTLCSSRRQGRGTGTPRPGPVGHHARATDEKPQEPRAPWRLHRGRGHSGPSASGRLAKSFQGKWKTKKGKQRPTAPGGEPDKPLRQGRGTPCSHLGLRVQPASGSSGHPGWAIKAFFLSRVKMAGGHDSSPTLSPAARGEPSRSQVGWFPPIIDFCPQKG